MSRNFSRERSISNDGSAATNSRGDLLGNLGRLDEARAEFKRAASLTQNARERALLLERAAVYGAASR